MPVRFEHLDDVAGAEARTSSQRLQLWSPALPGAFTDDSVHAISWEEGACRLPCTKTSDGRRFWELPSAVIQEPEDLLDHGKQSEALTFCIDGETKNNNDRFTADLSDDLYDTAGHGDDTDAHAGYSFDSQINRLDHAFTAHIDFIRKRMDQGGIQDAGIGAGKLHTGRLEDTGRFVEKWFEDYNPNEPPYRLIVRLAQKLEKPLIDLCRRPRMLLQQERQLQPVGSVQRVDAACLRWLSRQPGRTIQQKAGPRQQVMGIVRREQADTLENRLVRDVLKRADFLARSYLVEFGSQKDHKTIELVATFSRRIRSALRDSLFATVSNLEGTVQPNYVLQYESRYAEFWRAWCELMSERRQRDHLFRWRRRMVAEVAWLATSAACHQIEGQDIYRSDSVIQNQATCGQYVDRTTAWQDRRLMNGLRLQLRPNTNHCLAIPADFLLEISNSDHGILKVIAMSARLGDPKGIGILRLQDVSRRVPTIEKIPILADAQNSVSTLKDKILALGSQP